jgi:hypothetical protein
LVNSIILSTSSNISSAILLFSIFLFPSMPVRPSGRKTIGGLVRRAGGGTRRREAQVEPRRLRREVQVEPTRRGGCRRSAKYGTDAPSIRTVAKANGTESV